MPDDTLFISPTIATLDIGDDWDRGETDGLAMKAVEERASTPIHEIAWDSGLYDLDDDKDAKSLAEETELSLRFDEGDNFKLHLG